MVDRRHWLELARGFVTTPLARQRDAAEAAGLERAIDELLAASSPPEPGFADVFARVRALGGEAEARSDDDSCPTWASRHEDQRSYRNAIFPVKRKRIIALDLGGTFVPPATRSFPGPSRPTLPSSSCGLRRPGGHGQAIAATLIRFFAPLLGGREGGACVPRPQASATFSSTGDGSSPLIQRDYAQGRDDAHGREVRRRFVAALVGALAPERSHARP